MVHLYDVSMTYRSSGSRATDHLSLDIGEGEFVFLVGPSGSGKTTIIKLLTGEVRADEGEIVVNGFNLRTMRRRPDLFAKLRLPDKTKAEKKFIQELEEEYHEFKARYAENLGR